VLSFNSYVNVQSTRLSIRVDRSLH